jgi:uncharacterized protein (TIGR03083 family)
MVYLHKVTCMRHGQPQEWPPPGVDAEETVALLDRAYAELTAEFAARKPDEPSYTWYKPEQTVGFWIRRMAQETVIHRVDAEQALGEPLAEIPDDLALDGVEEVLERFLGYGSWNWREDFAPVLPMYVEGQVLIRAGERGWLVRPTPDEVEIDFVAADQPYVAAVEGEPVPMLLWLWRRADGGVTRSGDPAVIERLHRLLGIATQ